MCKHYVLPPETSVCLLLHVKVPGDWQDWYIFVSFSIKVGSDSILSIQLFYHVKVMKLLQAKCLIHHDVNFKYNIPVTSTKVDVATWLQ